MTAVAVGAVVKAAEALDRFAWSCVQCDRPEAQRYLSKLREDLRAALAALRARQEKT